MNQFERPLSRRNFCVNTAGGLAAAGFAPFVAACGATTRRALGPVTRARARRRPEPQDVVVGRAGSRRDQEGVDDTVASSRSSRLDREGDPPRHGRGHPPVHRGCSSRNVPDVQFLFNGIYHMENAGSAISTAERLIDADVLENSNETQLSVFEGKQYRVGFYPVGFGLSYNKDIFEQAGLDPTSPPEDWDSFVGRLRQAEGQGRHPVGGACQGRIPRRVVPGQHADAEPRLGQDALSLFIGDLDWRDPSITSTGSSSKSEEGRLLQRRHRLGRALPGHSALRHGQSRDVLQHDSFDPELAKQLGAEKVGYMVSRRSAPARWRGSRSRHAGSEFRPRRGKANAAAFLEFMHSDERVNAMWELSTQIPENKRSTRAQSRIAVKTIDEKWVAATRTFTLPT